MTITQQTTMNGRTYMDPVAGAITDLLHALEVDEGDHTADTPTRVAKAWSHMLAGYREDPRVHLHKTFSAPEQPGLVVVSGIELTSTCAHHLLPITGFATVGYRPRVGAEVVGLSKLTRLVEGYARRLQVQERIGAQVVDAIQEVLAPEGAACLITAKHGCMTLRGVECPESVTLTVAASAAWTQGGYDMDIITRQHQQHQGR